MGDEYSSGLIDINSPKIGKKLKMTQAFLKKFAHAIHDWLSANQMPPVATYATSVMGVDHQQQQQQQHSGVGHRNGKFFHLTANLLKRFSTYFF